MKIFKKNAAGTGAPGSPLQICAALLLCCLFFSHATTAQNFSLSVTKTNETCPGNGSLSFSVQNADTSAPVNYRVYILPNTDDAIFNSTATTAPGLISGSYKVIATQTVNGNTATASENIAIDYEVAPLAFTVTSTNAQCGSDGIIKITGTSGTIDTYALEGPATRAPQSGNIFDNLPPGTYVVKVKDICGTVIPYTYTLFTGEPVITISGPSFPDAQLPSCNTIKISHSIAPGTAALLSFPMSLALKIYPPGGANPVVYNETVNSDSEGFDYEKIIPFFHDVDYYYDITAVGPCGTVYKNEHVLIHEKLTTSVSEGNAGCGNKFLTIAVNRFVAPYTITFSEPAGFDPAAYNPGHPGPFSSDIAYGNENAPVPFGTYTYTVKDACNRTATYTHILVYIPPEPSVSTLPAGCNIGLGSMMVTITDYKIISASIDVAPTAYGTPGDVSGNINTDGILKVENLPPGDYEISFSDNCGNDYTRPVRIVSATNPDLNYNIRPGCEPGSAAIKLTALSPPFSNVKITSAPSNFSQPLPYDITALSNGSELFMGGLPPGNYTFTAADACAPLITKTLTLASYTTTLNEFKMTRHCGSFDIWFNHVATGLFINFWLQKELSPGIWGHPDTNQVYNEGELPTAGNSLALVNNATLYSIGTLGKFRIIKRFQTFDDAGTKECIEPLQIFDFYDDLKILNITNLTCNGTTADVNVTAVGAEPLNYKIVAKNFAPFVIDNGNNPIFAALGPAVYTVNVEDPCGHIIPQTFNIADLPPPVTATRPQDMKLCDSNNDNAEVFNLSLQIPEILNGQDAAKYTVTYYTSLQDAASGINAININYNSGSAEVFARVVLNSNIACYATTSFDLILYPAPVLAISREETLCKGSTITLMADAGFVNYSWAGGPGTRENVISSAGSYTVTVTDANGCTAQATVVVTASERPVISTIEITDWTDYNNEVTILTEASSNAANFLYSVDGIQYQQENTFTGLPAGGYTIYVKDRLGCGDVHKEVFLLSYPKYFTPNGDGTNETWRIQYSALEPHMMVYIYDRFGKVVGSFNSNSAGWDGTFNNYKLPATDYWFVVRRENGNELRGHFSLIR